MTKVIVFILDQRFGIFWQSKPCLSIDKRFKNHWLIIIIILRIFVVCWLKLLSLQFVFIVHQILSHNLNCYHYNHVFWHLQQDMACDMLLNHTTKSWPSPFLSWYLWFLKSMTEYMGYNMMLNHIKKNPANLEEVVGFYSNSSLCLESCSELNIYG